MSKVVISMREAARKSVAVAVRRRGIEAAIAEFSGINESAIRDVATELDGRTWYELWDETTASYVGYSKDPIFDALSLGKVMWEKSLGSHNPRTITHVRRYQKVGKWQLYEVSEFIDKVIDECEDMLEDDGFLASVARSVIEEAYELYLELAEFYPLDEAPA